MARQAFSCLCINLYNLMKKNIWDTHLTYLEEDLLKQSEEGTRLAQKYVGWTVKSIADSVVTLVSPDGSETVTIEPATSEYLEIGRYLV